MPELTNVKFTMYAPGCMSAAIVVAAQAVGDGLASTCLVLKGWHNLEGRYNHGGISAANEVPGAFALSPGRTLWGAPGCYGTALQFAQYCTKYGKHHDMMAPFMENSRRNGLLFPEGYWAQHRPEQLPPEDYLNSRWIAKPANLFDNDIPIMASPPTCSPPPTAPRTWRRSRSTSSPRLQPRHTPQHHPHAEEVEAETNSTGRKIYEAAAITPDDLSFENMYDGFAQFHQFHIEGLRYRGMERGDALDFYQTDISIEGPNPILPSGGNIGGGRSRFWMHTDSIQQIQGRAGARSMTGVTPEIGVSGGPMPLGGNFTVWSATPN